jgi:hypothetical protein
MPDHFQSKPIRNHPIASGLRTLGLIACALAALVATLANAAPPPQPPPSTASDSDNAGLQAAATYDAWHKLESDVRDTSIPAANLTVGDFLDRTGSKDEFHNKVTLKAEQIGGPRFSDTQTCTILLELPGTRVAQALVDIAKAHPDRSPIKPEALGQCLTDWKTTRFSATGSSKPADRAEAPPPGALTANSPWANVDDKTKRTAIDAAKKDAVRKVLESVSNIHVGDRTAGDIIQDADPVRVALEDWLANQPFTNLQFRDDVRVSYTVAPSGADLFNRFIAAAFQAKIPISMDQATLASMREEFDRHVLPTTGISGDNESKLLKAEPQKGALPAQPPDWVAQPLDAVGEAKFTEDRLRTKIKAEDDASENLRKKLLSLPLTRARTVGDAAKNDPLVMDAVNRAVSRARLHKVDYRASGDVAVRMILDPRDFWQELNAP